MKDLYKVCVCNLGYSDFELSNLDGKEMSFSKAINEVKRLIGKGKTKIDDFKITYRNYEKIEDDGIINIIKTEDPERCIYLRKI